MEQVKAFRLLPKELSQDDGELTATQKVRRGIIAAGQDMGYKRTDLNGEGAQNTATRINDEFGAGTAFAF